MKHICFPHLSLAVSFYIYCIFQTPLRFGMRFYHLLLILRAALYFAFAQRPPLIRSFATCPDVNSYYIRKVLPRVSPNGTEVESALHQRRPAVTATAANRGRPGGPSGLILRAPPSPRRFIEFGNTTGGGIYDRAAIEDGNHDEETNRSHSTAAKGSGEEDCKFADGMDFAGTQEPLKGTDELIRTDGSSVYTIAGHKFTVIKVRGVGAGGKRTGSLRLPTYPDGMLLARNFVVAFGRDNTYKRPVHARSDPDPSTGEHATVMYQIYVGDNKPRLVSTLHLEGTYVRALETDGITRIVVKFNPLKSLWLC